MHDFGIYMGASDAEFRRVHALDKAIEARFDHDSTETIIASAQMFEDYLKGDTDAD